MKEWLQWFVWPAILLTVGFYAGCWKEHRHQEQIVDQWQQRLHQQEVDSLQVIHEESQWSDKWMDCQHELHVKRLAERRAERQAKGEQR